MDIQKRAEMNRKHWQTLAQHQGQIVEVRQPQVAGRAEGEEGQVKLRLKIDHGDGSWTLTRKGKEIASGRKDGPPTVDAAIAMLARRKA